MRGTISPNTGNERNRDARVYDAASCKRATSTSNHIAHCVYTHLTCTARTPALHAVACAVGVRPAATAMACGIRCGVGIASSSLLLPMEAERCAHAGEHTRTLQHAAVGHGCRWREGWSSIVIICRVRTTLHRFACGPYVPPQSPPKLS